MFCQETNSPTLKDIQLTGQYSRSLLTQQTSVIDKLLKVYQKFQQIYQKNQQLHIHKNTLDKIKLKVNTSEEAEVVVMKKKLKQFQASCAKKQNQLAAVKKITISIAANSKRVQAESQQLRKSIKQKQEEYERLVSVKKEHILSSNQTQTLLKKVNFEIKQQYMKRISLKQKLALVRQEGLQTRSVNDLQAQINALEEHRIKMEDIVCELRQL